MRTKIKVLKNSPVLVEGRGGEWNNFGTFAPCLSNLITERNKLEYITVCCVS